MSDKISQKQAVIISTKEVLGDQYTDQKPVVEILSKSQILKIRSSIFTDIKKGKVVFNKEFDDEALKRYVSSMVSNHFRKARELNGNSLPTPRITTVGKKIKDDQLAALKLMLEKFKENSNEYLEIKKAIDVRENELSIAKEIKKIKKNKYDIDITVLPNKLKQVLND